MVKVAYTLIALYAVIVAVMYLAQRRLQYFPNTDFAEAASVGLPNIEQVSLKTADGETLVAWYAKAKPGKPVILYFHGNAGSIADRPGRITHYTKAGFGVLYVSYRGYGGSTGSPTEDGLVADGLAGYDWLVSRGVSADDIAVVGESLGSGVAVQVAGKRSVAAMALEAPYSSITDVAAGHYWWLPVRFLLKDTFDSISRIGDLKVPILITHGTTDQVVPFEFGHRLFEAANHPKRLIKVDGAGHDAIFDEATWTSALEFFEEVMGR
ncbi:MAG: alpha/beta hydrolase [Rhizobiales bacterium]|nr:alpha/beta hydrolase [Hyphomicrobiales bacterium]